MKVFFGFISLGKIRLGLNFWLDLAVFSFLFALSSKGPLENTACNLALFELFFYTTGPNKF